MNNYKLHICLMVMLFAQACSVHAETALMCPKHISTALKIVSLPDGWEAPLVGKDGESKHYLVSSTFTDGEPAEGAYLRPIRSIKGSSSEGNFAEYDFSSTTGRGVWLVCRYGNTPATVSKKLPDGLSSCKVNLPKDLSEQKVICR